jgi:hypothetical protein
MGQGFSLTTLSAGSANIDVPELADLQYEKSLGAARFMKAVRGSHTRSLTSKITSSACFVSFSKEYTFEKEP